MKPHLAQRKRVRHIALRARRLVYNTLVGSYRAIYKGQGMTFVGVRPYSWGDDVRLMDWKVTARTNTPHMKQYQEERERTVFILLDASASLFFGTVDQLKRDFAAELAALLVYAALFNQDAVGLLFFTDRIEQYIPPRKGDTHALHLIHRLLTFTPQQQGTDFSKALQLIVRILPKNALVILISDFLLPIASYAAPLRVVSQRFELLTFVITDPLERTLPAIGMLALEDAETQRTVWVDTQSPDWQAQFADAQQALRTQRSALFRQLDVPSLELAVHQTDYFRHLVRFFLELKARRAP